MREMKIYNKVSSLLLILILLLSAGCTGSTAIKGLVRADEEFENMAISDDLPEETLGKSIQACNQMGYELIQEMVQNNADENLLLSPVSLSFALAMVQNGAEGETYQGILIAMNESGQDLNERYNLLMNYINDLNEEEHKEQPGITIKTANSLWLRDGLDPEEDFVNNLSRYYAAQVYKADFSSPKTIDAMNKWVENQTNHLLKDTIRQIEDRVISYLMNTVYFKGTWQTEFHEYATQNESFYLSDGTEKESAMMHQSINLPYYEDDRMQITSLPYYGGSSMLLILPKDNLKALLSELDYTDINTVISELKSNDQRLDLTLPKLDYEVSNDLNELLINRGMAKAFSEEEAQFGKMVKIPGENVYISRIFQNARIIVDEAGTEAAAVTVVEMKTTSAEMPTEPIPFTCNKPYLYLIRDDKEGTLLFIGAVTSP